MKLKIHRVITDFFLTLTVVTITLIPNLTFAQTRLDHLEMPKFISGQEAEIVVRGANLKNVRKVDAVRLDGKNLKVIDFDAVSNEVMHIRVQMPESLRSGNHKIFVMLSDETHKIWIAPEPPKIQSVIQLFYNDSLVEPGKELEVSFTPKSAANMRSGGFILANIDSVDHNIGQISLPPGISLTEPLPATIAASDSVQFVLQGHFTPEQPPSGELELKLTNAPSLRLSIVSRVTPPAIPPSGTANPTQAPKISIHSGGVLLTNGQQKPVKFPKTVPGLRQTHTIKVQNIDKDTLLLRRLLLPAGFTLAEDLHKKLPPGNSTTLEVGFISDSTGDFSGLARLEIDNGMIHTFNIPLSVRVESLPAGLLVLQDNQHPGPLEPGTQILFDSTIVGNHVLKSFRVTNRGAFPTELNNLRVSGGLLLNGAFPASLASGETAVFQIKLAADSAKICSGVLAFESKTGSTAQNYRYRLSGVVLPQATATGVPTPAPSSGLWLVFVLAGLGVVLSGGGALLIRKKMLARRVGRKNAAVSKPKIRFEVSAGIPAIYIHSKKSLRQGHEIRLVPQMDAGTQQDFVMAEAAVIEETETGSDITPDLKQKPKQITNDDLTKIEGIGPKISRLLANHGIKTFSQLASTSFPELRKILDENQLWMTSPETWQKQAALATAGEWTRLRNLQDQLKGGRLTRQGSAMSAEIPAE